MGKYKPRDPLKIPRFADIRTFWRLPYMKEIPTNIDFAVVGIPFDTGASYRVGARYGPEAIRSQSLILRSHNPALDISPFDYCSGVDYGDIPVVPGYIEDSYKKIEEGLLPIIDKGVIPIALGGDHSITLAELRAMTKRHGPVALVQFDSHTDTDPDYYGHKYNHGTPFIRAVEEGLLLVEHSIQVGIRGSTYSKDEIEKARKLGFEVVTAEEMYKLGIDEVAKRIQERVGDAKVFVTFDIDFVDPAYAPGTGTPEVGGPSSRETLELVRKGLKGLNFVGFDLVEVYPQYDPSFITALLAAHIIFEFISLIALNKREKQTRKSVKTSQG
ncbi:agmatinase [Thermococcus sp. MV5]|uniref:agmatinase n=1 Tax=Thermococcus sp. MV5 TaxID=1638272 RepID=UPI0014394209|nr:agmatinase [Thermococcus sp. MV5]NJE26810.1 agmatinase [Thermococcus sp. MV5]